MKREDLDSLKTKVDSNQIAIKPADKGDMIVIQDPLDYRDMCLKHLNDQSYFENLGPNDPSNMIKEKMVSFADKY